MNTIRAVWVMAVSAVLAGSTVAGPQAVPKNGKRPHRVHGVVEAVSTGNDKDKDTDGGSITLKVHRRKKQPAANAPAYVERKFEVDANTKFEKVILLGKHQRKTEPATFADVRKGEHVVVLAKKGPEHVAAKVAIIVRQKGKTAPVK